MIVGIDKKGKEKHGTKKLGNIKTTAVDEDSFASVSLFRLTLSYLLFKFKSGY
ncbi:DUF1659 domain-containing protein [Clostridium sp. FP2]|nr:DUF1659 domain-containing protein [Clostridium sp. FP2]